MKGDPRLSPLLLPARQSTEVKVLILVLQKDKIPRPPGGELPKISWWELGLGTGLSLRVERTRPAGPQKLADLCGERLLGTANPNL